MDVVVGASVAEVMISAPKVHPSATTTVADARSVLADDHVHMLLLVDERGRLAGTVIRDDLVGASGRALDVSRLDGRTVGVEDAMAEVLPRLLDAAPRRLAVVDDEQRLHGLLCLKRSRQGLCDDAGVAARAAERV